MYALARVMLMMSSAEDGGYGANKTVHVVK